MSRNNEELALAYQDGELEALATLWAQVERLAWRIVSRYRSLARSNGATDNDDLMQAAFLGVERAAKAFAPDAGAFATLMGYYVRTECAALLVLRGSRKHLEHYYAKSADQPVPGTEKLILVDTNADANQEDEDERLFLEDIRRDVRAAIDRLGEQEAEVVRAYYLEGVTTEAIGRRMGICKSRVAQLRAQGMRTMRRNRSLLHLIDEAVCWRRKGVTAFNTSWSSVVEDAVVYRDEQCAGWQ